MSKDKIESYRAALWPMPLHTKTHKKKERRLGVEIEFSGLDIAQIATIVKGHFGGNIDQVSDYESFVRESELGDFGVELDFAYLKKLGREKDPNLDVDNLDTLTEGLLALLAKRLVPCEIVSPPLLMSEVWRMDSLIMSLRDEGAKGTKHAIAYAFGLQFNPEMPNLKAETILAYLRAFLTMFDWLKARSKVDLIRRVTPYIDPFEKDYIQLVMAEDYAPDINQLIDDYLKHNPTRNRALDMLPLFAHIDEERVRAVVKDDRVKARPTLHYRLPNCQIDEPEWGLIKPWRDWLQIDTLASDPKRLDAACKSFRKYLKNPTGGFFEDWASTSTQWLLPELL